MIVTLLQPLSTKVETLLRHAGPVRLVRPAIHGTIIQRDPKAFFGRVEAGEIFIVLRDECPLAEVRPLTPANGQPRPYGLCAGQFSVPDDFDKPLSEAMLKEFEGA